MHSIAVMGPAGDTPIRWRRTNLDEVEDARRRFQFYRDKGYSAFRLVGNDQRGARLDHFDPDVESAVMVPPMAGG